MIKHKIVNYYILAFIINVVNMRNYKTTQKWYNDGQKKTDKTCQQTYRNHETSKFVNFSFPSKLSLLVVIKQHWYNFRLSLIHVNLFNIIDSDNAKTDNFSVQLYYTYIYLYTCLSLYMREKWTWNITSNVLKEKKKFVCKWCEWRGLDKFHIVV